MPLVVTQLPSVYGKNLSLRLRSHWYEYEYEFRVQVSVYGSYKLHPHEWAFMVTCTRTTQRVSTDNLQL